MTRVRNTSRASEISGNDQPVKYERPDDIYKDDNQRDSGDQL